MLGLPGLSSSYVSLSEFFDGTPPYDEVLERSGVVGYLRQFAQPYMISPKVLGFIQRHTDDLLDTMRRVCDDATTATELARANVTELLAVGLTAGHGDAHVIITTAVPLSLTVLAQPTAPSPATALCAQRLLLAAFDADFALTTHAVAAALDETVVRHLVRSLAASSIVAETVIALFGSALSAVTMMEPTTQTQLFTRRWIELGFTRHLVDYFDTAVADENLYNYFYFMRQLLRRGFGHSAGPVVDELLNAAVVEPLVEKVVAFCEADAQRGRLRDTAVSRAPLSLAGEAMALVVAIASLLRKSLPVPERRASYDATLELLAPWKAIRARASRLVALLKDDDDQHALGAARLAVCELFVELMQFRLACTDELVVSSGFLRAFLALCRRHPNHDPLARQLQLAVIELRARRPLVDDDSAAAAASRDVLLHHTLTPDADVALVAELAAFAVDPALRWTTLSAFAADLLPRLLSDATVRDAGVDDAVAAVGQRATEMGRPITGLMFTEKGSAGTPPGIHRALVNHAGDYPTRSPHTASSPLSDSGHEVWPSSVPRPSTSPPCLSLSVCPAVIRGPVQDDTAPTLERIAQEGRSVREAGSPQLRAYPSFRTMRLTFTPPRDGADETKENAGTGERHGGVEVNRDEPVANKSRQGRASCGAARVLSVLHEGGLANETTTTAATVSDTIVDYAIA